MSALRLALLAVVCLLALPAASATAAPPECDPRPLTVPVFGHLTWPLGCPGATTLAALTSPATGTFTLSPTGTVDYTPAPGFVGVVTFAFQAGNGDGLSAPVSIEIMVGAEPAPACLDRPVATTEGTSVSVVPDCWYTTQLLLDAPPAHGTARLAAGVLTYTPDAGFVGTDTLRFAATGPSGTSLRTLTVSVGPRPLAAPTPSEPAGTQATCLDVETDASAGAPTEVRLDCSETVWGWSIVRPPAHGTLGAIGPLGTVTYTPDLAFHGVDRFTFRADGPQGGSAPATVAVRVTGDAALAPPPATLPRCGARTLTLRLAPHLVRVRVTLDGRRVPVRRSGSRWTVRLDLRRDAQVRAVGRRGDGRLWRMSRTLSIC
jgi:large repetitive protein